MRRNNTTKAISSVLVFLLFSGVANAGAGAMAVVAGSSTSEAVVSTMCEGRCVAGMWGIFFLMFVFIPAVFIYHIWTEEH